MFDISDEEVGDQKRDLSFGVGGDCLSGVGKPKKGKLETECVNHGQTSVRSKVTGCLS